MGLRRKTTFILLALALVATACTSKTADTTTTEAAPGATAAPGTTAAPTDTTAAPSAEGSVRFLIAENFWADWDPYQHTAQSQGRIEAQIFDYLVDFPGGDLSSPQPMLATEWTQIDDSTWEFRLREGVTFHDGSTFDGEDVKASIELSSGATETPSLQAGNWIPTT
ncbi:MAG: ABC transporter substrate-binding protein, partial [Acidimicrobiia bacterium]